MWKNSFDALMALLKKYRSRICYYGGVTLVLTAIAFAAEAYRGNGGEELVLPQAEIAPVLRLAEPEVLPPGECERLRGFSDSLSWNRDLGQWESHAAVDYRILDGFVRCAENGTVRTVGESGLYGGFVEVEAAGRLYRYASVKPDESIRAGKEVAAGDLIGIADESMPGERYMGSHLHLELIENGRAADFESLVGKNRE